MAAEARTLTLPRNTPAVTLRSRLAAWSWPFDRIAPLERLMRREGDMGIAAAFGMRYYIANHPELIQECLVTRGRDFHKDPYYRFMSLILGKGLLTSEAPFHLRQRRMIQPPFHRERINAYGRAMVHYAEAASARWEDGQRVDMSSEMMALALAIVGKTLFDSDMGAEAAKVAHALEAILPLDNMYLAPWGRVLFRVPIPPVRRFRRAIADIDEILYRMIAEHKASGDRGDLLSMLLAAQDEEDRTEMTDRQVRDEAITLFLAGHETTAIALTWTFYCLSQNAECEARMHAEIDAVLQGRAPEPADYTKLDYTRRVFAESMRLYPPAYMMGRLAIRDTQLGTCAIPEGACVLVAPYITQRDPRFWPDPLRFDPERFTEANSAGRHKFAYFPFGGGQRLCIGEPFAWMEGVLVLASLARRWTARMDPSHRVGLNPRVTLRPKGGMRMTLHRRA